uniref:Uncharacterized protein n=1 Tax=Romanomermis culicivorax TaxID=13658 RepID=A0A915IA30_ROMCU
MERHRQSLSTLFFIIIVFGITHSLPNTD